MQETEAQTVSARLYVEVFVNCPNCNRLVDLLDARDTDGHDHNEEGRVISQACPEGNWIEAHQDFEVKDVTCSRCNATFNVKQLEW